MGAASNIFASCLQMRYLRNVSSRLNFKETLAFEHLMPIVRESLSRGATVMVAPIQGCSPRKVTLALALLRRLLPVIKTDGK